MKQNRRAAGALNLHTIPNSRVQLKPALVDKNFISSLAVASRFAYKLIKSLQVRNALIAYWICF